MLLHITGILCGILVPYTSAQLLEDIDDECGRFGERNNVTQACYQFKLESVLSWKEAYWYCKIQRSDLLSITSQAEQDYISGKLMNKWDIKIWLGLKQIDETLEWRWTDGAPLAFWKMGYDPSNAETRQCAMYLETDHTWYRHNCEYQLPFVCKRNLMPRQDGYFDNWKYYPTRCESDWIPYNRRCCKLRKEELGWSEASAACRSDGGELMSVHSLADVEFLLHLLDHENVSEAWIGLSSHRKPVDLRWSDGSAVTIDSWQTQEPNFNLRDSDLCVSAQGSDGNWKLRPCKRTLFSVCKKPGRYGAVNDGQCAENWVRHGDYCYGVDLAYKTFEEILHDSSCPLATITNRFEQAFISSLIYSNIITKDKYFWIGLKDINQTGKYSWLVNSKEDHGVNFTNWETHEPSTSAGCVVLAGGFNRGRWIVRNCDAYTHSLCKKPLRVDVKKDSNPHKENMGFPCLKTWDTEPHLPYCYKVFHREKLTRTRTWQEAKDFCQDIGAHLVSLSNKEEEQFVEELLSTMFNGDRNRKFWTGLNKLNSSSKHSWEWSDGSPVVSPFWHETDPNNVSSSCVAYRADTQLELLNCNEQADWVCKFPEGEFNYLCII